MCIRDSFPGYEWFEAQLRADGADLLACGALEFAGYQANVSAALADCDIAPVAVVEAEGFGDTAGAGVVRGRPVCVSHTGGAREGARGSAHSDAPERPAGAETGGARAASAERAARPGRVVLVAVSGVSAAGMYGQLTTGKPVKVDRDNFYGLLARAFQEARGSFLWVRRQLTPEQTSAVEKENLRGVGLVWEYRRIYPNGDLAAPLLGRVGEDGRGLSGLEHAFDEDLWDRRPARRALRDGKGRRLAVDSLDTEIDGGRGLRLSLDRTLQYIAERELDLGLRRSRAKGGAAVTAVSAPGRYAYVQSGQLSGMLGGMKGAAEYENLIEEKYHVGGRQRAMEGMGSQSIGHLLIMALVIVGNIGYFVTRRKPQ